MSTHKGLLCLETRSTLHLLTLNTHGFTLVLQVHALQFLLTAKVEFLLSAHGIEIQLRLLLEHILLKVVVEVEVGNLGIMLSHHTLLLQIGSEGFEFTIATALLIHVDACDVETADGDAEKLLHLWSNTLLDEFANLKNLALNLNYRNLGVRRGIANYTLDELGELATKLVLESLVAVTLISVHTMEEIHVLDGIYHGTMYRYWYAIILQAWVEDIKVRDGKVQLTTLAQVAEVGQVVLFHSSRCFFGSLSFFFFYFLGRFKTKKSHMFQFL